MIHIIYGIVKRRLKQMKGSECRLIEYMEGSKKRFIIPVYQRNYDWKMENCQQRLTTVSLLFLAMYNLITNNIIVPQDSSLGKQIYEDFLVDKYQLQDTRIKLKPVKNDQKVFGKLFESTDEYIRESNLTTNYNYFYDRIQKQEITIDQLFDAIFGKGEMKKLFKHFRDENEEVKWILECSSEIPDQALCDLDDAYKRFWKGKTDFPRWKRKHQSELSFYHSSNKIKVKEDRIYFEKIGWVKIKDENRLVRGVYKGKNKAENAKVYNPRIKYNGKYWYLAVAIEMNDRKKEEKSDIRLGIDVGLKELATCSDTKVFPNINKSKKIKKLEKRLKKEQRKSSRQLCANTDHYEKLKDKNGKDCFKPVWKKPLKECKNIQKPYIDGI